MPANLSFLDIVNLCDNVRVRQASPVPSPYDSERLVPFYLSESPDSPVIGLLRPVIIEKLKLENQRSREIGQQEIWALNLDEIDFTARRNRANGPSVSLRDWLDTHSTRTAVMKEVCERWRDTLLFEDICGPKKWREELYPVYADPLGVHDHPNHATPGETLNFVFEMERSACALFGVITYGVHMSIYEELEVDGKKSLRVWVPTRSRTKQTFPGLLDNTVAGGIPSGMPVFESLVKECMEEASIAEDIARKYIRTVGAISYFFRTSKGWLQPEVEYVYDIRIPPEVDSKIFEPRPLDGEVESFELLTHDETIQKMRAGLFKPNCALVLIDLFIRLGYITPENEPDYMKIITQLHGTFDLARW
ncbi:nudix hydrolase 20 [Lyophyllum atratum]|nr:nudix hydrolase 20 [Lyophyllum atratum]